MKKLLYISLLILAVQFSYSQTDQPTTVYTCKNGSVSALNRSEYSQSDITYWTNYTSSQYGYLGITIIGNASRQYNCHGYAWHLTEGNTNKVWINNTDGSQSGGCYINNNNINKYWTDGCFIQVCNEADADKIHYYCGDHSAVKSTVTGKYESKWGGLALVRHNLTSVPYAQPTTVHYYASTKISGSTSNLCTGTRTFSVKNIPGATYTWTKSSNLTVVGSSNTYQYKVQRNGSSSGAAWVQVQITTPCSGISATSKVDFTVGIAITGYYRIASDYHNYGIFYPLYNNNSPIWLPANELFGVEVTLTGSDIQSATWSRASNSYAFSWSTTGTGLNFSGTSGSAAYQERDGIFNLTAQTTCGVYNGTYKWPVIVQGGGFSADITPNPASDNLAVSINDETSDVKSLSKEQNITMMLYNLNGTTAIKTWTFKNNQNKFNLNVNNIKKGQYILVVRKGKYQQSKQVVIQ